MPFLAIALLNLFLAVQAAPPAGSASEAKLELGHYRLTVQVNDTSRGQGVPDVSVEARLRRGFLVLGRMKKDIQLKTDAAGRVLLEGMPEGKVELLIYLESGRPQVYDAKLEPGLKRSVELRSGRYQIRIEWVLV